MKINYCVVDIVFDIESCFISVAISNCDIYRKILTGSTILDLVPGVIYIASMVANGNTLLVNYDHLLRKTCNR
ncbi:hypothetical protein GCM10022277_01630 [Litoribacillus peritrichatus]|uniref:Uncharacterized protein n=1 Tax=Litoribacillus peritrichatus TaxID=718191 RepID=A0ABP7M2D8_9GAMM